MFILDAFSRGLKAYWGGGVCVLMLCVKFAWQIVLLHDLLA